MVEQQVFCLGVRAHAKRGLSLMEREWLGRGIETAKRHAHGFHLAQRVVAPLLVLGAPLWFLWTHKPGDPPYRAILFYVVLIVPSALGLLGALSEILWGSRSPSRMFFGVGLVASLACATQYERPEIFGLVILIGPFVVGFGILALFARYQRLITERRVLDAALRDHSEGQALQLKGAPDLGIDPPSRLKRSGLALKRGEPERAFDILPNSGLLLPGAGLRVEEWIALDVIRPAAPEPMAITAAVSGVVALDQDVDLRQRHLTAAEADEIKRHRGQLVRRAVWMFFVFGYIAARVVQGAELVLGKSHHGDVSGAGWLIAALSGLAWTAQPLRLRAKLGRALAVHKVFIVRKRSLDSSEPVVDEVLAGDVVWTTNYEVAPWRLRKL